MDYEGQCRELGLDPDRVATKAEAYAGYAHALLRNHDERRQTPRGVPSGKERTLIEAASSFAISASFYAIVTPGKALPIFRDAATCYRELGQVSGIMFDICGLNRPDSREASYDWKSARISSPDDAAAILLYDVLQQSLDDRRPIPSELIERATDIHGARLGMSHLSLDMIIRFHSTINNLSSVGYIDWPVLQPLVGVLDHYLEELETASADTFHWKRLQQRFLPVPPEILATSVVFLQAMKQTDLSRLRAERRDKRATLPLDVANALIRQQEEGTPRFVDA